MSASHVIKFLKYHGHREVFTNADAADAQQTTCYVLRAIVRFENNNFQLENANFKTGSKIK